MRRRGWNSWNWVGVSGCDDGCAAEGMAGRCHSEVMMRQMTDVVAAGKLKQLEYEYINLSEGWPAQCFRNHTCTYASCFYCTPLQPLLLLLLLLLHFNLVSETHAWWCPVGGLRTAQSCTTQSDTRPESRRWVIISTRRVSNLASVSSTFLHLVVRACCPAICHYLFSPLRVVIVLFNGRRRSGRG